MDGETVDGEEFRTALTIAAMNYLNVLDNEHAVESINRELGWSFERARWFITVNQKLIEERAHELRAQQSKD